MAATAMSETYDNIEMLRTPLKSKNHDFSTAPGKRQTKFAPNFATPTKRSMLATPKLGNKNIYSTPNTVKFKKPALGGLIFKTPGKPISHTPSKTFSVFKDHSDTDKFDSVEQCPWANAKREEVEMPPPEIQLIQDYVHRDPPRKQLCIREDADLVLPEDAGLQFNLDLMEPLPELDGVEEEDDEVEQCPVSSGRLPASPSPAKVELNISRLSDLDMSRLKLDSLRIFDESIRTLECTLEELELPSTPELDQELSELLELSFDMGNL